MEADYCEIRVVAKGPTSETANQTLAITFTFSHEAVDRFKALIPWHDRSWGGTQGKTWYAHLKYLEVIKAFARDFDGAMFIDGERWENLRTGQILIQGQLF
jgi:hypothetical protein